MAAIPEFQQAVELRPCTILTTGAIDDNPAMAKKLDWIKQNDILGFRRDKQLFHEYGINLEHAGGLVEAYEYTAPVINVDIAMGFLMDIVKSKGA
jgi:D-amino-acid oxidase